jgi:uncharacterized RDD family membrane protein YckC
LADAGQRLLAWLLDGITLGISYITLGALEILFKITTIPTAWTLSPLILFYLGIMYAWRGQTLGMKAMHIRVAMLADGSKPDKVAAWKRSAAFALPYLLPVIGPVCWLVNVLWQLWDRPHRQCLHDKFAKTMVVYTDR